MSRILSRVTLPATGPLPKTDVKKVSMNLAQKISKLREERGWSQTDLGKKVGVNQRYVSTWETGRNMPHVETLIRLAQVFEVSVDYLVLDDVPREPNHHVDDIELYEQFRQAEALPAEQKKVIKQLVGAVLFQYKVKTTQDEIDRQNAGGKKPAEPALRKVAGKR